MSHIAVADILSYCITDLEVKLDLISGVLLKSPLQCVCSILATFVIIWSQERTVLLEWRDCIPFRTSNRPDYCVELCGRFSFSEYSWTNSSTPSLLTFAFLLDLSSHPNHPYSGRNVRQGMWAILRPRMTLRCWISKHKNLFILLLSSLNSELPFPASKMTYLWCNWIHRPEDSALPCCRQTH